MRNYSTLRSYEYNGICDICGFKFKNKDLFRRWDGYIVCKDDYETRHPLDFYRNRDDFHKLPWIRPEPNYLLSNPPPVLNPPLFVPTQVYMAARESDDVASGSIDPYVNPVSGLWLLNNSYANETGGASMVRYLGFGSPFAYFGPGSTRYGSHLFDYNPSGLDTGTGLYATDPTNFVIGTNDFTLEAWFALASGPPPTGYLFDTRSSSTDGGFSLSRVSNELWYGKKNGHTSATKIWAGTVFPSPYNTWIHIAVVRNAGVVTTFVNGVGDYANQIADTENYTSTTITVGNAFDFSGFSTTRFVDSIRFHNGTALYTTNFTPPASEWTL